MGIPNLQLEPLLLGHNTGVAYQEVEHGEELARRHVHVISEPAVCLLVRNSKEKLSWTYPEIIE